MYEEVGVRRCRILYNYLIMSNHTSVMRLAFHGGEYEDVIVTQHSAV
jgi:hypothetical protein